VCYLGGTRRRSVLCEPLHRSLSRLTVRWANSIRFSGSLPFSHTLRVLCEPPIITYSPILTQRLTVRYVERCLTLHRLRAKWTTHYANYLPLCTVKSKTDAIKVINTIFWFRLLLSISSLSLSISSRAFNFVSLLFFLNDFQFQLAWFKFLYVMCAWVFHTLSAKSPSVCFPLVLFNVIIAFDFTGEVVVVVVVVVFKGCFSSIVFSFVSTSSVG